jgi:hypothetical protein
MSLFKFDYKSEDEIGGKAQILEPGLAAFEIKAFYDADKAGVPKVDKDGTPKISLSLRITDSKGHSAFAYDDITQSRAWKIKALADSIGKSHLYSSKGSFNPDDLIGCTGKCVIVNNEANNGKTYTNIDEYLPAVVQKHEDPAPVEDMVPF